MKKLSTLIIAIIVLSVLAACTSQKDDPTSTPEPTEAPPVVSLTISGSGSVTPILNAIADEFEAANPGYLLEVLPGSGTGGGVRGIVDGTLDVAAMSRGPRDSEAEQGVEFVQFGSSSTAVMTHPDVGISELSAEQLTGIFLGTITNWSEVGGSDQEIIVYVRDPEEGNTVDIREAFIGEEDFPAAAQVMPSQTDMQNVLNSVEGAIGYGTWATMLANGYALPSLTIDGIGVDNVSEARTTIMGIGYLSDRKEDVQALIDWLLSGEGQAALESIAVEPVATE